MLPLLWLQGVWVVTCKSMWGLSVAANLGWVKCHIWDIRAQGWALTAPVDPCHLPFAFRPKENFSFFFRNPIFTLIPEFAGLEYGLPSIFLRACCLVWSCEVKQFNLKRYQGILLQNRVSLWNEIIDQCYKEREFLVNSLCRSIG